MKIKLLISLVIGGLCLWLALRGTHWSEVAGQLHGIDGRPLVLFFLTLGATHLFRVRRWQVLLRPIRKIGLKELFGINAVGFLAIHAFPFRIGEAVRPLLLKRRHRISFSAGLATVAIERVFDGLLTALCLFVGIYASPANLGERSVMGTPLIAIAYFSLALFLGLMGFFLLAVLQRDRALSVVRVALRIVPSRYREKVQAIISNFFEGLAALPDIQSVFRIFLESICVWGVVVVGYWAAFRAFHMDLSWGAACSVLGIVGVGAMLPNAPGFVGTFQLFTQAGLSLYGISKSTSLAFSLVVHALSLLYVCLAGFLFLPSISMPVRSFLAASADGDKTQP